MTLWPAWRAASAIAAPRPEEAPVISQVFDAIVKSSNDIICHSCVSGQTLLSKFSQQLLSAKEKCI